MIYKLTPSAFSRSTSQPR